jgi:predicted CxxxxCH...CXXCH cytochrome family protein
MRPFAAVLTLLTFAACAKSRSDAPWLTYPQCTSCHGDFRRGTTLAAAAPPFDVSGDATTTARGVGAHQRHLDVGVACAECHPVPGDQLHADGIVEVAFGPIGSTLFDPVWNSTALTCSTYCHGGTTGGGSNKTPLWTKVDGTQAACGTCHGVPPPAPHIQSNDCGGCHAGYTSTTVDPLTHVDGMLQTAGGCTACHGDPNAPAAFQAAPPRDTQGNVATSAPGVGAHLAHLAPDAYYGAGNGMSMGVACAECHPTVNPATHPDHTLHVVFGPLAAAAGAAPQWKTATLSCSAVYCHGATLTGGANTAPVWNRLDGTAIGCGACHGLPPRPPHPQETVCGDCHTGYTISTVNAKTHINGVIDMDPNEACSTCTCTACHGDSRRLALPSSSAPPRDTHGNTLTTAVGVGAHVIHLDGGPLSTGVSCTECHPVPASSASLGAHRNGVADLDFGPLSNTSTVASWSAGASTCASYCHGATIGGGTNKTPLWTQVDGTQAACGTCHGVPPPGPHPQRQDCGACHPGSTSSTVDRTTHVNGNIETVTLTCTTCHGTASRALVAGADPRTPSAPPPDTVGSTATSYRSVGAHLAHLNQGSSRLAAPTACTECHVVPSSMNHANGTVNVTFGALSRTGGKNPVWNGATCAATYCHGGTLVGGVSTAPIWTKVDGTQKACNACHGNPPSTGKHSVSDHRQAGCGACHPGSSSTTVNAATHVNGLKETGNKVTTYSAATRNCTNTCHGNKGSW